MDTNNGVNGDGSTEGNVEDGGTLSSPLDGDDTTIEGSNNGRSVPFIRVMITSGSTLRYTTNPVWSLL